MTQSPRSSLFFEAVHRARQFIGATAPNPPVGAVAVDTHGTILSVQAHEQAGTGHAEAKVLADLKTRGLLEQVHTLFITLEPCNHHGRTPPCTEAILTSRVPRVIYGVADPNPRVAGQGARRLREAGVEVCELTEDVGAVTGVGAADAGSAANTVGAGNTRGAPNAMTPENAGDPSLKHACRELIRPFAHWATTGLPWVVLKTAYDRSGSMIPPAGQKTFTQPSSLKLAHELRRRADAILTGSGTVIADSPEFTVRHVPDHPLVTSGRKKRKLVVLDRRGRTPPEWIRRQTELGFEVWIREDLPATLLELGKAGVLEVLVECGPELSSTFLQSSLWNQHVLITQGKSESNADLIKEQVREQSSPT